ncbi:MAG: hypothetical protein QW215_02340 [Ignisphaera sp.]
MYIVKNLYEYLSIVDKHKKIVVVGENCRDCHVFLNMYEKCIAKNGFFVVVLPIEMDDDLLEFFHVNNLLCLPIVVIDFMHHCGDLNYLGSIVCRDH